MKKLLFILTYLSSTFTFAACPPDIFSGIDMGSLSPAMSTTVNTLFCAWPNEYYSFSAQSGETYYFSTCNDAGSPTTANVSIFDNSFTHLSTNQGNGFDCAGTKGSIAFVAPSTGTFYVMFSRGNGCNTSGTQCMDTEYWTTYSGSGANSAPDCDDKIDVCTNLSFEIDASGAGAVELPAFGGTSNPDYSLSGNPWSGNQGCQMDGETYPTWLRISITQAGDLAFTFGGNGSQSGYYDWNLWRYDADACADIAADNLAPLRCNWNGSTTGGTGCENSIPGGGDATNYEPELTVNANEQYLILFNNYSAVTTTVPLDFTNSSATVSCSPLPVDFVEFNVKIHKNQPHLSWVTMSETNCDKYEIQRSEDGKNFYTIATVDGMGTTTQMTRYDHIDEQFLEGTYYYRIKQIDIDGQFTIHGTQSVTIEEHFLIQQYQSSLRITNCPGNGVLSFHNYLGQISHQVDLEKGDSEIDLPNLPGFYILNYQGKHAKSFKMYLK